MSYTSKVTIEDNEAYQVVSYGNGAAYAIVRKSDDKSIWLQDDAAGEFLKEYETAIELFKPSFENLPQHELNASWETVVSVLVAEYFMEA